MKEIGDRAVLCEDGKYRWIYSMNLFKNPTVFFMVYKILFCIFAVMFIVINIADAINFDDFYPDRLLINLKFSGYILIGLTAISLLGYLIYSAKMGGRYTVLFEMDEAGINHMQIPEDAKKAKKLGAATALAGAAAHNVTSMGIGINATRTGMYSDFSKVKRVKAYPARRLIKVNGALDRNRVYTAKEDFDFVSGYISAHCQNAVK